MRVSSEETLKRAALARDSGKSWFELTRSQRSLHAGLHFFSGSKTTAKSAAGSKERTPDKKR